MPTVTIEGVEEKGGIPPGAYVQVVMLPGSNRMFGSKVDGPFPLDLDEGKYKVSIRWTRPGGGISYRYEFFHGVNEREWVVLRGLAPTRASARMQHAGAKWFCGFPGCSQTRKSHISMALHEGIDHFGMTREQLLNPSTDPILRLEMAAQKAESKRKDTFDPPKPDPSKEAFVKKARRAARGG